MPSETKPETPLIGAEKVPKAPLETTLPKVVEPEPSAETKSPEGEKPSEEEVVVTKPVEEEKKKEVEDEEPDYKALLEEERKAHQDVVAKLVVFDPFALDGEEEAGEKPVVAKPKPEVETKPIVEEPSTEKEEELFSQPEFDTLFDDRDTFNTKISAYLKKREVAFEERITRRIAKTNQIMVSNITQTQRTIDTYFGVNQDVSAPAHRGIVEAIAVGLVEQKPSLTAKEALTQAGAKVRKQFRLEGGKSPAFSTSGGVTSSRRATPKLTELEKEMSEESVIQS